MLSKAKLLRGYTLNSRDGEIGKVKEFYFDDRHWAIRYLVADTGNWLTGRQVLISPYSMVAIDSEAEQITVDLTQKQIEESPSLDTDKPVSRQFENTYYGYYGLPMYWGGPHMWGSHPHPVRDPEKRRMSTPGEKPWDAHLRSTQKVTGYHIQAKDGEIGHVEDFIVDDETWAIRYLIIDTGAWWTGKKVLVSPKWIERVSWNESKVFVNLPRETVKQSPEWLEKTLPTREYETGLYRHYRYQGYWIEEQAYKEYSPLG